jgi:hypothetical protein
VKQRTVGSGATSVPNSSPIEEITLEKYSTMIQYLKKLLGVPSQWSVVDASGGPALLQEGQWRRLEAGRTLASGG